MTKTLAELEAMPWPERLAYCRALLAEAENFHRAQGTLESLMAEEELADTIRRALALRPKER